MSWVARPGQVLRWVRGVQNCSAQREARLLPVPPGGVKKIEMSVPFVHNLGVALWHHSKDLTPQVAAGPKQEAAGGVGQGERPLVAATAALFPFLSAWGQGRGLAPFCVPLPWSSPVYVPRPSAGCSVSAAVCPACSALVHEEARARLQFQPERALHTGATSHPVA